MTTGAFRFTSDGELFDRLDATHVPDGPEEKPRRPRPTGKAGRPVRRMLFAAIAALVMVGGLAVWSRHDAVSATEAPAAHTMIVGPA